MENVRFVGLDVHADSIAIAVAEPGRAEPQQLAVIPHDVPKLIKRLKALGQVKCCYEAGPTGFGLKRTLEKAGIECAIIAPSLVPTASGSHIKTDRRDAAKLARFFRSGDLSEIHVPNEETEAIRDLERAREAAKRAERVARHQLGTFLLRHERRYDGKTLWSKKHLDWIRTIKFNQLAQQRVLEDYLRAVEVQTERVAALTKSLMEITETWSKKPLVKALQAFRGISTLSATILAAELDDLSRFPSAPKLMGYLGLVPSERSSGESRRRGQITRAGNSHVRKTLVEAAWAYRFRPAKSRILRARSKGVSPEIERLSWRAQERLCGKYAKLASKGKNRQQTIVAIARELAGFIWAVGQMKELQSI